MIIIMYHTYDEIAHKLCIINQSTNSSVLILVVLAEKVVTILSFGWPLHDQPPLLNPFAGSPKLQAHATVSLGICCSAQC